MFGIFKSRPPLSTSQRVDLEWLMRRSRETFGDSFFHRFPVILSTGEIEFDASSVESKIRSIAKTLSPRFAVDAETSFWIDTLQWKISTADSFDEPAVYQTPENESPNENADESPNENPVVIVHESAMQDDLQTIMLVANVMARHVWQRFRLRDQDVDPQITSLLPIITGLGVLASEASLLDNQWSTVGWSGWSLSRSGYYNTMEIGYAMALVDRVVNTNAEKATWLSALRLDSRSVCKRAMQSFKQADSAGDPILFDAVRIPNQTSNPSEIAAWLAGADANFALAASTVACNRQLGDAGVVDAALQATERSDVELIANATRVLANASPDRSDVKSRLKRLATHRSPMITFAAMKSAVKLGLPHGDFLTSARQLLAAESFDLIPVLAWIESGGVQCASLKPILLRHLEDAKRFNHTQAIESLECCINAM